MEHKFNLRVHNSLPLDHILSQMNSVATHFFSLSSILILSSHTRLRLAIWTYITVFTRAWHWSVCCSTLTQFKFSYSLIQIDFIFSLPTIFRYFKRSLTIDFSKIMYAFLISPLCNTCPAYLSFLGLITLTTLVANLNYWCIVRRTQNRRRRRLFNWYRYRFSTTIWNRFVKELRDSVVFSVV
jgi:hypothetical protein